MSVSFPLATSPVDENFIMKRMFVDCGCRLLVLVSLKRGHGTTASHAVGLNLKRRLLTILPTQHSTIWLYFPNIRLRSDSWNNGACVPFVKNTYQLINTRVDIAKKLIMFGISGTDAAVQRVREVLCSM